MRRKALINLISCVLSIAIVAASGIFLFSKLYKKEKEIVSSSSREISELSDEKNDEPQQEKSAFEQEENTTKKSGSSTGKKNRSTVTSTSSVEKKNQKQTTPEVTVGEQAAQKEANSLGFLWDPIEKVFYSVVDPWKRNYGLDVLYDAVSPYVTLYYDTIRIEFNYNGFDWLVQFWKGQYGFVLLGAEVGVYYKPEGVKLEHYFSSDNDMMLKIGYKCYDKSKVIFSRQYQETWWLSGFVGGKLDFFNDRSEMAMEIRITLKNVEMRDSFVEGLEKCGFTRGNASISQPDTYYTYGNDVYVFWQNISQ